MKKAIILSAIFIASYSSYAQDWFDGQCDIVSEITDSSYKKEKLRNILTVIIDQENNLILNNKPHHQMSEVSFKEYILNFITNPKNDSDKAENPKSAIIALTSFGNPDRMELIQDYIREVYLYLWNKKAIQNYDTDWPNLKCNKREKIVKKSIPYNLYFLENKTQENKSKKRMFPSAPQFQGDVKDN